MAAARPPESKPPHPQVLCQGGQQEGKVQVLKNPEPWRGVSGIGWGNQTGLRGHLLSSSP